MGFLSDDIAVALRPVFGAGHANDMLLSFWKARGFSEWPGLEAELAFYRSSGAVGTSYADVRADYWNRVVLPFVDATFWLDAGFATDGSQWVLNRGAGGQRLRARVGSVGRAEVLNGVGLVLPGASGNFASVPDSAALDVTGDLEIAVRFAPDTWTPSPSNTYPFGKRHTGAPGRSWLLELVVNGMLGFYWSADGTVETRVTSTVAVPFAEGEGGWVRITLDVNNGSGGSTVRFFTAADSPSEPSSWTQLGLPIVTAGVTSVFASSADVTFGGWANGGANMTGLVQRGIVRDGISGPAVLDVDFTTAPSLASSFVCSTGQTVSVSASNAVDANDPLLLPWSGENYVYLPGVAGNYASTPDAAVLDIAGDIDIRVRVALDDWTPGADTVLVGKLASSGNQRSYSLRLTTGGTFYFTTSPDGINGVNTLANAANALTNGQTYWIRATLDVNDTAGNRVGNFYWAPDSLSVPTVWNPIGTTVTTAGTTSIHIGTAPLEIGSFNGGTSQASGKFYRAQVLGGIDGTVVFDADFTKLVNGSQTTFTEDSVNAATVTINRSATGRKSVVVDRNAWLFGSNDYLEVADNALLDFSASESFTVMAVYRDWGSGGTMALVSKVSSPTTAYAGYALYEGGTSAYMDVLDASTQAFRSLANSASGTLMVSTGVRDVAADLVRLYRQDGATGTTPDGTTGTFANTVPLRVGRFSGVGTNFLDAEVFAVAVWRRALSATEIAQVSNYYARNA